MSEMAGNMLVILLCLMLVGSGLIVRRLDAGTTIRLALIWVAIFAGVALAVHLLGLA